MIMMMVMMTGARDNVDDVGLCGNGDFMALIMIMIYLHISLSALKIVLSVLSEISMSEPMLFLSGLSKTTKQSIFKVFFQC